MESETTSSSEILWLEILSRIPFVKSDNEQKNKIRIDSKIEVEEEDAMQLEQWISNQEVIISHSCTMQPLQFCRGIVEYFEYERKNLKVTVSTESDPPIWEDTDIWMFSTPNSSFSFYNQTEPNTSIADLDPIQEEEDESSSTGSDDEKLFRTINGWKLIGKKGYRERRKVGEHWKNVYLTELEVTTLDPMEMVLLKNIKVGTPLRFSVDIEEPGDVFVDVVRTNIEEGSIFTIVLGVTGFAQTDVNIPLTKDQTYYLNIDDGDFDEMASVASEPSVLPGYPLHMNIDELCEKLGKLTFTDACIKSWLDPNGNVPFIRLIVTSDRKMQNFKLLTGHHVIIQSEISRSSVSAVVSKVMRDEMILTLRGFQKESDGYFFFSKTQLFTIQIDHSYENWLKELTGEQRLLEDLRQQIVNGETDIRRLRVREEQKGEHPKTYASFATKTEANAKIPIGTRVLLGKTWEVEGLARKKADFVFAIRVEDSLCETNANTDHIVTFEIIHSRNLVDGAPEFELSKAFYFVDFDSHQVVADSPFYSPLNARDPALKKNQTVSTMHMISKELKFNVFRLYRDKKPKQNLEYNKPSPLKLTTTQKTPSKGHPQPPNSPSISSMKSDDKKQKKGQKGGGQKNNNNNHWKSPQTPNHNNNNEAAQKNMEMAVALHSTKVFPQKDPAPQKNHPAPKLPSEDAPPPPQNTPYKNALMQNNSAPKPAPQKGYAPRLAPPTERPSSGDAHPKDAPKQVPLMKKAPPTQGAHKPPPKDPLPRKNPAPKLAPPPVGDPPEDAPPPQEAPNTSQQSKAQKKQQQRNLEAEKQELKKVVDADEPWKVLGQIDEKHKRLCYVYITRYKGNKDTNLVRLCSSLDEHGQPTKTAPWALGKDIVLTPANETEIKLNGQVVDTNKIPGRGYDSHRQEDDRHGLCEQAAE
ncbi:unnamed protein product [Caenorhabditis brenneri]